MSREGKRLRLLLADDHAVFIEPLSRFLQAEFEIVGTAASGDDLVDLAKRHTADVALVDISMPRGNGLDALRTIKELGLETRVVFLTMHESSYYARRALEAGAYGYIVKSSAPGDLVRAIRAVGRGETWVTPSVAEELRSEDASPPETIPEQLTPQRREVLRLLAAGKTAKEIGARLGLTRKAVEYHKYRTMQLLGLDTAAALIRYAVQTGIYSPPLE